MALYSICIDVQHVELLLSRYPMFTITFTSQMSEGLKSSTVFFAITCIECHKILIVAGFNVDRQANMLIVLNEYGSYRFTKFNSISIGEAMPIVEMHSYIDRKLEITHIISWSIISVYVHCLKDY